MTTSVRFFLSVVMGTIAVYFGVAFLKMFFASSPFSKIEVLLALTSLILFLGCVKLTKGSTVARKCCIALISLMVSFVCEIMFRSRNDLNPIDPMTVAFSSASQGCQSGWCQYKPNDVESLALFGADTIYSLAWKDKAPCRLLSFAANYSSGKDSIIVDYEQYKMAEYLSKSRFISWIFRWQYPNITLISRSEVPCLP